jgi:hypothetical protein
MKCRRVSARIIRFDYCDVRSVVRYPQHRTLLRPTKTRVLVAFLRPIRKQRAQRRSSCVLASVDLANMTRVRPPKNRHNGCNESAGKLLPGRFPSKEWAMYAPRYDAITI